MHRRDKIMAGTFLVALLGVAALFGALVWFLWRESVASEEAYADGLANTLGQRTERIIVDIRDMLAAFDRIEAPRCSAAHLQVLQEAAVSRAYIRGIGY